MAFVACDGKLHQVGHCGKAVITIYIGGDTSPPIFRYAQNVPPNIYLIKKKKKSQATTYTSHCPK